MTKGLLELPRLGTDLRKLVDYVNTEIKVTNSRIVDLSPLRKEFTLPQITRILRTLYIEYRWYNSYHYSGKYDFGEWALVEDGKFFPDPRWRTIPKSRFSNRTVVRMTEFRPEPPKDTLLGEVYRFLVNNRTPGTGVVNVEHLYDKYGSKKVSKLFHELKKHYGFSIVSAGQKRNFIVKRLPNRKLDIFTPPFNKPGYKEKNYCNTCDGRGTVSDLECEDCNGLGYYV